MTIHNVHVVVLAAGKGTRMKSELAKVLHDAAGLPLITWVMRAVSELDPASVSVVVGYQAEQVSANLPEGTRPVLQAQQNGTGHAVSVALAALSHQDEDIVLVVLGDMPLVHTETLQAVVDTHVESGAKATVLTSVFDDPSGYGRVIRDGDRVVGIVEERDASEVERAISEVNTSIYAFDAATLREALDRIGADNDQGELYLTDVIGIVAADGLDVATVAADASDVAGVNSHDQLAEATSRLRRRINRGLMVSGVWMADPDRTYVDATVTVAPGARIHPDVHLVGDTVVDAGAEVGPSVFARDSRIGAGAHVWYSVLRGATVGPEAEVGPYASLRPGTVLMDSSKAGTFVEVKATTVGKGSKVPHLSYVGDAMIGEDSNIGAGTITVNYDGYDKHETRIGDRVRIGSDTMLVAPVEVGDDAYTGAGSVITHDVSPGSLAVERSQQKEIPGYAARRAERAREERE